MNSTTKNTELLNARRWLVIFILAHVVLWTLGSSLFRDSIHHDTLESIAWGSQWQWGYNKHPFLAAWLNFSVSHLSFGHDWPIYLLAQLMVAITIWAVWRVALHFLPPKQALLASLSLEGVLFYNLISPNLTPDTLQSPLWALLTLCFYQALTTQTLRAWLGVGLFTALAVVTKYQIALLMLPMLLLLLLHPNARLSFKNKGVYLAGLIALLLLTPHLIWLYQHHGITIQYALDTAAQYSTEVHNWPHLFYSWNFIINSVIDTIGVVVLLWPIYRCPKMSLSLNQFQWQFLVLMGFGPWCLSLLLCIHSGHYFPPRWATPYFFLIGIGVMSFVKPQLNNKTVKKFLITLAIFLGSLWCAQFGRLYYLQTHQSQSDATLPNQAIANKLTTLWHQRYHSKLHYIAGSRYLVAAISVYSVDKPTPYFSLNQQESPWIDAAQLRKDGAIIVIDRTKRYAWDKESQDPASVEMALKQHFPNASPPMRLEIKSSSKEHEPVVIWVVFIPPQSSVK